MKLDFTIEGTSELMTDNPTSLFKSNNNGKPEKAGSKQISIEEEAEMSCYRLDDGSCGFPVLGIRSAILEAAKDFKVKGKRYSFERLLKGSMVEPMEFVPLLYGKKPAKEYKIDSRRVVTRNKSAIIVHRPKFAPGWRISFSLLIDRDLFAMSEDQIREQLKIVITDAGARIGIGAFRPANRGWFGRFKVV
jgi:hypothetical protein